MALQHTPEILFALLIKSTVYVQSRDRWHSNILQRYSLCWWNVHFLCSPVCHVAAYSRDSLCIVDKLCTLLLYSSMLDGIVTYSRDTLCIVDKIYTFCAVRCEIPWQHTPDILVALLMKCTLFVQSNVRWRCSRFQWYSTLFTKYTLFCARYGVDLQQTLFCRGKEHTFLPAKRTAWKCCL